MTFRQFNQRMWMVVAVTLVLLLWLFSTLFDLQINQGEEYYARAQYRIAETEIVESDRGDILDRNGRILVSNQTVYQVTLDTTAMGDARNQTILDLIHLSESTGVEWTDTLPITTSPPFAFTTDTPYYTVSTKEDGSKQRYLTRLGTLAVRMKWIEDPTKDPEPVEETPVQPKEPGFFDRIKYFFLGQPEVVEESTTVTKPVQAALPSAQRLLGLMCRSFELAGEGAVDEKQAALTGQSVPALNIGDMSPADARAAAGVLYELYLRSKGVNWNDYIYAEEVDIDFISQVKEHGLTGVKIEAITKRQYHTPYAAHILGRVGPIFQEEWESYKAIDADGDGVSDYDMNDTVGKDGVERAFEAYLRGTPGIRTIERSTTGKVISQTWLEEPQPGSNVVLTLDIDLQKQVEDVLSNAIPNLTSKEAEGAACVVLDVDNADVLACASYPTFDLSTYSADFSENSIDPLRPLFNRALQGVYPPGSTFKMVTAIAGLEEGIVTPATKIRDTGVYTFYRDYQPKCWIFRQYGGTHGMQNVSQAITNSCNYYFYEVGRQLGIQRLGDYAGRFGLGQTTGLELYEEDGVMAGPEYTQSMGGTWYDGSTLPVSIGQESSQFTPIQLANYIATLVNGGTRNATHLLKEIKSSDYSQILSSYEPRVLSTIEIQPQNLQAVKAGMLELTTSGSVSSAFRKLDIKAGAKTGSAQVSAQTESNAVFVCFAPYDDPEIALAVVVEHGGSGGELASIAVDVLSYYFSSQENREVIPLENTLIR